MSGTRETNSKNLALFLLSGMVITAFILRMYHLGLSSLWEDEIQRVLNATIYSKNFGEVVKLASIQSQPPLSYWLNRIFLFAVGGLGLSLSDALVRIPSVIYGVLTVPIFFLLVKDWFGSPYDLFATLLLIVSPLSIRYSQEVGPIALWLLVTVLESYILVKAIKSKRTKYWFITCLAMIISVYTHIFATFIIALQVLTILIYYLGQRIIPYRIPREVTSKDIIFVLECSIGAAITFLLVLVPIYLGSTRYIQGLDMSVGDFVTFFTGALLPFLPSSVGLLIIMVIVLIGLRDGIRQKQLEGMLLIAMVIGFPIVEYIAFVFQGLSYFQARYAIAALPFFITAFVLGIVSVIRLLTGLPIFNRFDEISMKQWSLFGSMLLAVLLIIPAVRNVYIPTKQDWRGVTQFLEKELDANDVLIFSPEYFSQYYNYYNEFDDRDRQRYALPEEKAFLDDIYWVTKDSSAKQFNELSVEPQFVKSFTNNLYLWKYPVQENLNSLQVANQDFIVKIEDGTRKGWPVGWGPTGSGVSIAGQDVMDGNETEIGFYVEDKDAGIESLPIPVQPNQDVMLTAEIQTEQLNQFGAIVSLIIRDRAGNSVAKFDSDAVGGTHGWRHVIAGGIVPGDGDSMQIAIRNVDVPKKNASVSIRNIQVYSSGILENKIVPIQQNEIPDFYNEAQVIKFWEFPNSQNEKMTYSSDSEQSGAIVSLETLRQDSSYLASSPTIDIKANPGDHIFFGVDVKTENLRGDIGFGIAIGWINDQGKTIQWSESQRLTGTNGWQQLWIAVPIPQNAVQLKLIPLRLYDAPGAGEKIWISNPVLYSQGELDFPDTTIENYQKFNLPYITTMMDAENQDGFWKYTDTDLVRIDSDPSSNDPAELAALRFVTNGSDADFMVSSPRIPIEVQAGANFVFNVDVRTEDLSGEKGVEIAIGWFDQLGKNIGWSESQLLRGTNDWMTVQVNGSIPEDAEEMTLIPLRIFDSQSAGEQVWIKNVRLYVERGE